MEMSAKARTSSIVRKTKETDIKIELDLDGALPSRIETGIPFMDHMLEQFAKHGGFGLDIKAKGDLNVDFHHTIEDIGIVLGKALKSALGEKRGIARYGWCILPMDEALVLVAIDISGRPLLKYEVKSPTKQVGGFDARLFHEFFQALTSQSGITLHIKMLSGDDAHHVFEAIFKAFAKALSQATKIVGNLEEIPSTKGIL